MEKDEDVAIFHQAIINGNLASITKCIQNGLIIDQSYKYDHLWSRGVKKFTPLICAAARQKIKVVQYFLSKGADVLIRQENGETPLSAAARNGNLEIVKLLLENGAKPNMQTALLVAIENKKLSIVQYLFEKGGACINWEYVNGATPLSKSIMTRSGEIANFFIDNGANLEKCNNRYSTPLILSVENRMLDTLKCLIKKGVNINQVDNNGRTALSVAAEKRNLSCAMYLIESGADISLAQKAVDAYTQIDEDFNFFLKRFKSSSSNSGSDLSLRERPLRIKPELDQEEAPSPKRIKGSQ